MLLLADFFHYLFQVDEYIDLLSQSASEIVLTNQIIVSILYCRNRCSEGEMKGSISQVHHDGDINKCLNIKIPLIFFFNFDLNKIRCSFLFFSELSSNRAKQSAGRTYSYNNPTVW